MEVTEEFALRPGDPIIAIAKKSPMVGALSSPFTLALAAVAVAAIMVALKLRRRNR